jgi:tetratricopeptide (TPR) repeat protein
VQFDARGLPLTAGSAAEIASVDCFTGRLLRIDRGAESILEDTKTFPETPLVQLCAAAFCLYGQTRTADQAGIGYLKAAEPMLVYSTEREQWLHRAFSLWSRKDHLGALDVLEDITKRWPRDLLAAKVAEFLYYVLGQQHEGPRFLRHMTRLAEANKDDPDFLAIYAFAYELCGDLPAAQQTADRALQLEPKNPWAHHCMAHIYLRKGDTHGGLEALESYLPIWIAAGRVIHCHNVWHLALAHLDALDSQHALDLYARHIWNITPECVGDQIDAISLLWRLEMAGTDVGRLWDSVADHVEAHVKEHYMPFLDAHFVYALARSGRIAVVDEWLALVVQRAASPDQEARRSWAPVGRPLIEASAALARGDAARSAALLDPVMSDITIVGGSDAQVDLFRLAYFHSLLQCGRKTDAKSYWSAMTAGRKLSQLDRYRLGLADGRETMSAPA